MKEPLRLMDINCKWSHIALSCCFTQIKITSKEIPRARCTLKYIKRNMVTQMCDIHMHGPAEFIQLKMSGHFIYYLMFLTDFTYKIS